MPDIWMDVDVALAEVPVNLMPLIDDTDFKTIEDAVAYNASGMDLRWNFVTAGGSFTSTPVTPTTSGTYDWTHQGDGIYTIEIPASGGASINNDTEGFGWFSGKATGVYPWRGPVIGFRAAALNDALIDGGDNLDVNVTQFGGTNGTFSGGRPEVNASHFAGTAVGSATVNANMTQISGDSTAADNLEAYCDGTTPQPVNVTQFGGSAGTFTSGRPSVNASHIGGTSQTGRDIGASVLLSSGTGTGQVSLSSGQVTVSTNNDKTGYGLADGAITAAKIAGDAITAAKVAADAVAEIQSGLATSTALATAQADLDILTGTDGVILATTQANYAPAKAGNQMDLVNTPNATAVTAIQSGLSTHSAADVWSVGTRVLTAGTNIVLAKGTGITGFNDIAATDIVSGGAINTSSGAVSNVTTVATATNLTNLPTIPNNWITAAGIAADAVTEIQSGLATASALATVDSNVDAILVTSLKLDDTLEDDGGTFRFTTNALEQAPSGGGGGGDATEAKQDQIIALIGTPVASLATDIAGVKSDTGAILDDTGTSGVVVASGSKSGYSLAQSFPSNFASLAINASGHVVLQDASLTTGKLGTFALAKGTNITGFNDLSAAQVNAEADTALADYDAPTKAELDALQSHGDSTWATATGFSTFDPANDTVARVTLVDTVTTLTGHTAQTGDAYAAVVSAVPDSIPADGSRPSIQQAIYMLTQLLTESSIEGTTWTIKKPDGTTTLFTITLNDAEHATSKTRAT